MFELTKMNGWILHFIFSLLCVSNMSMMNASMLHELSHQEYVSSVHPRKTSLIYFTKDAPPNVFFLEQLEQSVEPLKDYGISVAKVNCLKEDVSKYCGNENAMMKAYLFRGNVVMREFPTDALFDVNAIVANVLFAILFNEVKYITTILELQIAEDYVKGRNNLVFVYVRAIGIPEHRAVMEAAFVYGAQYKFVLTTEVAMLENLGIEESSKFSARFFFCHCKMVTDMSQQCRRTLLEEPLSTLNIHRYFKLMEAPLVAEVTGNPEEISSVHLQLGLPLVFVLSQKETYELDKRTAEHIAWQLLGKAGLAILLRDFSLDVPLNANVVFKQPDKEAPVKYLALQDAGEIIALVEHDIEREEIQDYVEEEEGEKDRNDQDVQDDQVAEAVHRDKKTELALELAPSLTEETFHTAITGTDHAVVLFYASWEAVSLVVLQTCVEVAIKLKETSNILLSRVNCADWPDVCKKQNVTHFPAIKMYFRGENPSLYTGMLGAEDLLRFINLRRLPCPLKLFTIEDVEGYLSGHFHKDLLSHSNISLLGIFSSDMNEAREAFVEAGNILKGYSALGIYFEEHVHHLSRRYGVTLPALLLARHNDQRIDGISLSNYNAENIVKLIRKKLLESFSEITVENLPAYLRLQKPLLILFSNGNLRHSDQSVILKLVRDKHLDTYATCWLNLKNTPVGLGILKRYFGSIPLLPQLVLVDLHSKGQAFAFPSDQSITEVNILHWLKKVQMGMWNPSTIVAARDWKPLLPDYNFLGRMDAVVPQFAAQRIPVHLKSDVTWSEEDDAPDEK